MTTLEDYEAEVNEILDALSSDPQEAEDQVQEAKAVLKQMDITYRGLADKTKKAEWKGRIQALESKLSDRQKKALTGSASLKASSGAGKGKSGDAFYSDPSGMVKESFDEQKKVLDAARRELAETEKIGEETLLKLAEQKEVIKKTHDNVKEINDELSGANKILTRMGKWWRG
jgi:hypothetical protein